jgi:hypothetical protein
MMVGGTSGENTIIEFKGAHFERDVISWAMWRIRPTALGVANPC